MEKDTLGPLCTVMGYFSFMVFGVVGYMNLSKPLDITNIIFGIVVGLLFGFISKFLFTRLLSLLNRDVKAQHGKKTIRKIVKRSSAFMFPYAILVFLSTYFLGWASAGVFYSAAIMNTGIVTATEVGKLKGKNAIQNTIITSVSAALLAYLWLFSASYLKNVPALIDSLISLVLPLLGVNK